MNQKRIMYRAINHYGVEHQVDKAIEEMSELTKALIKYRYADYKKDPMGSARLFLELKEEMADAYIMLKQLELIYHELDKDTVDSKLKRLSDNIENDTKDKLNKTMLHSAESLESAAMSLNAAASIGIDLGKALRRDK